MTFSEVVTPLFLKQLNFSFTISRDTAAENFRETESSNNCSGLHINSSSLLY